MALWLGRVGKTQLGGKTDIVVARVYRDAVTHQNLEHLFWRLFVVNVKVKDILTSSLKTTIKKIEKINSIQPEDRRQDIAGNAWQSRPPHEYCKDTAFDHDQQDSSTRQKSQRDGQEYARRHLARKIEASFSPTPCLDC